MISIDDLRRVDYFHDLSDSALARLQALAIEIPLLPSGVLFLEGEDCRGLYLVISGRIRIYKASPEGREQVLMVARAGESFAEVPVFDGGPNPASAAAMEETVVALFPKAELIELLRSTPEIGLGVIRVFARRLRHMTRLIEDLSFRHVTARVARLLLQYAQPSDGEVGRGARLTQQEMATMVGTAREVVTRALHALEAQGAIEVRRGQILVLKPELLERLV